MNLLGEITKSIPFDLYRLGDPKEARKKLLEALESASSALDDISTSLEFAEAFAGSASMRAKLGQYQGKIGEIANILALPETAIKNYQSAIKIIKAVSGLRGKISDNPQAAAKAFGKLFSGIGELAHYLPPPINGYLGIFADAENFFENIRVQMQPEVHMKESSGGSAPGVREIIDNL